MIFLYVCEKCVDTPDDSVNIYDNDASNHFHIELVNDINGSMKAISDQVDFASVSTNLLQKIVEMKTFNSKFKSLQ